MEARLPHASPRSKVRDTMSIPASPYLQERLQAQRGHTKRTRRSDFGPRSHKFDDDLFMAEAEAARLESNTSPSRGTPTRELNGASRESNTPKALGAREMDKHMDKLSKVNFDLKMDLFHCRERMARLQEQCDGLMARNEEAEREAAKAEQLARERKTLLDINEDLVKELEKRDEAVKEAVGIICDLEEKIESLTNRPPVPTSSTPRTPSLSRSSIQPSRESPASAPSTHLSPGLKSRKTGASRMLTPDSLETPVTPHKRVPSFMCEKKASTNALRSVYLEPSAKLRAVKSYASIVSQRDDLPDMDGLDSPRLSVLSESSFASMYNPKQPSDAYDEQPSNQHASHQETSDPSYERYKSDNSRISEWVASRPAVQQPPPRSRFRDGSTEMQYQSLDDPVVYGGLREPFDENNTPVNLAALKERPSRPSAQGYGAASLPPTPESVSTRLLRESRSTLNDGRSAATAPRRRDSATVPRRQASFNGDNSDHLEKKPAPSTQPNFSHQDAASGANWQTNDRAVSSSSEEFEGEWNNDSADASSSTIRDIGEGYGIRPDGGSMITGTPSRFQVRHISPPANNLLFDGDGIDELDRPVSKRRNTGADTTPRQTKTMPPRASLPRAETSPSLLTTTRVKRGDSIHEAPRLHGKGQQGRSSNDECRPSQRSEQQSLQKINPKPTAPSAPGVRASIAQKTHKLFRRMSDSRGESTTAAYRASNALGSSANSQISPRRPKTAQPSERRHTNNYNNNNNTGMNNYNNNNGAGVAAAAAGTTFLDGGVQQHAHRRRPSSQDSDLALVAANQAIASRRPAGPLSSHQPETSSTQYAGSGKGPLSPGHSRGFFKRAGSVRR